MRGATTAGRLALAALLAGCGLIDGGGGGRTCGPGGAGQAVDELAGTFGAREFLAQARVPGAAVFVWVPQESQFPDEAIYVLCLGESVSEAGSSQIPLLSAAVAAVATRIGASITGVNGDFTVEPGYVIGRVNRDAIVTLEVVWTTLAPAGEGSWEVGVDSGLLFVPVPPGVPPDSTLVYRFLDENGDAVWVENDGF